MSFSFNTKYGNIDLVSGLPQGFMGPFLHESQQHHALASFGSIVLQELKFNEFTLSLFHFEFFRKLTLVSQLPSGMQSVFIAKGKTLQNILGISKLELHACQFFLFNIIEGEWRLEVQAMKPLHLLHASYSSKMAEELIPAFPVFEDFLKGDKDLIRPDSISANILIRDTVQKILHAGYEPNKLPFYFKNKVREYLFLLLEQASSETLNNILQPGPHETEALYKVRDMILSDVRQHHVISDLAKKVKMNQYRLKIFFKREFGVGPYKFLLHARMDKAKELIDEGKPMKEAVSLAGYTTTSFITAFRKRYGYTPGSVKRKPKENR